MVKVVTPRQMADAEKQAYQAGYSEEAFMEQAGAGIAETTDGLISQLHLDHQVLLLCGKGNNGGDAYVAGRYLLELGYKVAALQVSSENELSPLCKLNRTRFLDHYGVELKTLSEETIQPFDLIIDGLFGTGFRGKIEAPYDQIIAFVNQSKIPIVAVDIPSGLNGESGQVEGEAIKAYLTVYLGGAKWGFFLNQGWNTVGVLQQVDFGLPEHLLESQTELLQINELSTLLPHPQRTRHKYQRGYVVGLSGSPTMPGASLLSSLAALRGGAGIVRLLHPAGMEALLSNSPYELIKSPYQPHEKEAVIDQLNAAGAVYLGPGIGTTDEMKELIRSVLPRIQVKCVLDADALNIVAQTKEVVFPKECVITPHHGEMGRLLGSKGPQELTKQFIDDVQAYSTQRQVIVVLKGAPTLLFHPNGEVRISPYGNAGMATAGSGDVLTGVIAALASQGLPVWEAAQIGVVLHGLAGDIASVEFSEDCLIASDIIHALPEAFQTLRRGQ
jgi:NAD(P)H-hydrate epimerase